LCLALPGAARAQRAVIAPVEPAPEYHFARAQPGWAVSGTLKAGLALRAETSVGYGLPHWLWAGADLRTAATPSFASQAVGLRLVIPLGELALEGRRVVPFAPRWLRPKARYAARELHDASGGGVGPAEYQVLEAWTTLFVPLFGGVAFFSGWVDRVYGVPEGSYFFEEVTRVIAAPRWVGSEQLAYLVTFGGRHHLGPIAEHVWSSRDDANVVRLGLAYAVVLGPHLRVLAYATEPVATPDALGAWDAAGGTALLSYAWSSTDPSPGLP
jgi:hypothetical protein